LRLWARIASVTGMTGSFPDFTTAVHPKIGDSGRALHVRLTPAQADALAERLEKLTEGDEMAWTLKPGAEQWSCFFKLREGDTRFLLAHPALSQWVATLALQPEHRDALVARLRARESGVLDREFGITRLSNLSFGLEFV
jgi:hypothetical protein